MCGPAGLSNCLHSLTGVPRYLNGEELFESIARCLFKEGVEGQKKGLASTYLRLKIVQLRLVCVKTISESRICFQ